MIAEIISNLLLPETRQYFPSYYPQICQGITYLKLYALDHSRTGCQKLISYIKTPKVGAVKPIQIMVIIALR